MPPIEIQPNRRRIALILMIPLALLAAGCSRQRTSVAVDAALLTQVPGDTIALGAMRVKALKETSAWKTLLAEPGVQAQLDRLAKDTNFDVRTNLWEVLWSTDGKDTLVFARGEFAPMGLEPRLEREGFTRMSYKGTMLLGNEEQAVWFVNSSTGIYGPTPRLRSLIDSRDKGQAGPSAALRARIDQLPPDAHFWMVADGTFLPRMDIDEDDGTRQEAPSVADNLFRNLPKVLESVQQTTFHVSLTDGVAMEGHAYCADETGARRVVESVKGLAGLVRMLLPASMKPSVLPLLDSIQVTQAQTDASLKARLTTEEFAALQNRLGRPRTGQEKEKAGE